MEVPRRIGSSRTELEDGDDEAEPRLLLRLWINVSNSRPLISALRELSERFTNAHAEPKL